MIKLIFAFSTLAGMTAVMLGAFAAHGLSGRLEDRLMSAFETGVTYQMTHALILFGVGLLALQWGMKTSLLVAAICFMVGILMFSGSLYGLALTGMGWLGPVTPIGGVFMIVGWAALTWAVLEAPLGS